MENKINIKTNLTELIGILFLMISVFELFYRLDLVIFTISLQVIHYLLTGTILTISSSILRILNRVGILP